NADGDLFWFPVDFVRCRSTRKCRETFSTTCPWQFSIDGGTTMRRILFGGVLTILTLSLVVTSHGGDKSAPKLPAPPTNAALEKMKKLAGTWLLADKDGKPTDQIASIIKVTAGGSAIHETLFPGQPHEMVSIYTVDGADLVMTHYCVL